VKANLTAKNNGKEETGESQLMRATKEATNGVNRISGSQGGEYDDGCLAGCSVVLYG
jgi:hypothetical protein